MEARGQHCSWLVNATSHHLGAFKTSPGGDPKGWTLFVGPEEDSGPKEGGQLTVSLLSTAEDRESLNIQGQDGGRALTHCSGSSCRHRVIFPWSQPLPAASSQPFSWPHSELILLTPQGFGATWPEPQAAYTE